MGGRLLLRTVLHVAQLRIPTPTTWTCNGGSTGVVGGQGIGIESRGVNGSEGRLLLAQRSRCAECRAHLVQSTAFPESFGVRSVFCWKAGDSQGHLRVDEIEDSINLRISEGPRSCGRGRNGRPPHTHHSRRNAASACSARVAAPPNVVQGD